MTVNKRLKAFITNVKTNPTALSKQLGLSGAAIKKLVDGNSLPSSKVLVPLVELYPNLNLNWLLIGQGEMFINDHKSIEEKLADKNRIIAAQEKTIISLEEQIQLLKKRLDNY